MDLFRAAVGGLILRIERQGVLQADLAASVVVREASSGPGARVLFVPFHGALQEVAGLLASAPPQPRPAGAEQAGGLFFALNIVRQSDSSAISLAARRPNWTA